MSLDAFFSALPCSICKTPMNVGCDCWVNLECTGCGRKRSAERDATDPPGTALIKMLCPECAKGDRSLIDYFDKGGRQIDLEGKPMLRPTDRRADHG
jgi:hypothetical protein